MDNKIFKEKINQAIKILNEKKIDMWITFVRESSIIHDPAMDMVVGTNSTWQAAFIINKDGDTTAIVGDMEEENFVSAGLYKNDLLKNPLFNIYRIKTPKALQLTIQKILFWQMDYPMVCINFCLSI